MPDKKLIKQFLYLVGFLLLCSILLSVFFRWYAGFAILILAFLTEFGCRWYKYRKFPISFRFKRKTVAGDISTTADQMPVRIIRYKASEFLLKNFVDCAVYKDYSSLGEGSTEEIQACFNDLLNQYHIAKNDDNFNEYLSFEHEVNLLDFRKLFIESNITTLETMYMESSAMALHELYKDREFSPETYKKDIIWVRKFEKNYARKATELREQIKNRFGGKESTELKPDEQAMHYLDEVMTINQILSSKYDFNTITLAEFGRGQYRVQKHIEHVKNQTNAR